LAFVGKPGGESSGETCKKTNGEKHKQQQHQQQVHENITVYTDD